VLRQLSQSETIAVEADDLVKDFGETRAVEGVSLVVPTGSIYGLLGPNGAGKTTTLRMLLGIIDPSSGTRRVLGHERPLEMAPEIGYLPEERGLYPAMHARDAIAFVGALRGLPLAEGRRRADALLADHNLADWAKKPIRTLSKGMAQTVQLLGTIIHKPRLLVLDEPFAGLDAINQAWL
jgi:ABC-2 type transport system ATP-binding protein